MRVTSDPTFDPFGEPMDLPRVRPDTTGRGRTRRAAVVFWALAVLLLGGRIYLSDHPVPRGTTASAQVSVLR